MVYLFRYSLSLIIVVLIQSRRRDKYNVKRKRDISDLKDDPILTSIFRSDLQETRSDRSISLKDEKEREKIEDVKQQELLHRIPLSSKGRRDTYNSPYEQGGNTTLPDTYYANINNPIIGNQILLPTSVDNPGSTEESAAAVEPKLFTGNYMPLENQLQADLSSSDESNEVTKRDSITLPVEGKADPMSQSIPLQLRKYTPNHEIGGVVSHHPEYGETVESVERAQKVMDIKRSMMPGMDTIPRLDVPMDPMMFNYAPVGSPMYSDDVSKKNAIPVPPIPPQTNAGVFGAPKISQPVPVELAPTISAPVAAAVTPQVPATIGSEAASQQASAVAPQPAPVVAPQPASVVAPQPAPVVAPRRAPVVAPRRTPVVASQVQNLDGAYARPRITEEECDDQYAACEDFAKNNYCTKYNQLMQIQCRKSCGFCVPNSKRSEEQQDVVKGPQGKSGVAKSASRNAPRAKVKASKKVGESTRKEIKADKRSPTANTSSKKTETYKKASDTSRKKAEASNKAAVSTRKSTQNSKKAADTSKETTETSKKHSTYSSSKGKAEAKSTATKRSNDENQTVEKIKKEGHDGAGMKSKIADVGSANEVGSGSGDVSSAELGSGSASGSGEQEQLAILEPVVPKKAVKQEKDAKKSTTKRSNVPSFPATPAVKFTKPNFGEFTFPVARSEVSTASLTLNEKHEKDDGSGSASGDDFESEEKEVSGIKHDAGQTQSGEKATVKTTATHQKVTTPPKRVQKTKVVAKTKKNKESEKPTKQSKAPKPQKEKPQVEKQQIVKPQKEKPHVEKQQIVKPQKGKQQKEQPQAAKPQNETYFADMSRKSTVPAKPKRLTSYPKIDLKLIASALAHYEEAALELAGEYPKAPPTTYRQEVARSEIPKPKPRVVHAQLLAPRVVVAAHPHPHPRVRLPQYVSPPFPSLETKKELIIDPLDKYKQNLEIARLLTDDRNGRSNIPKYLKLTKDAKVDGTAEDVTRETAADSLPSIQKRFSILGIEPTLIDYYAETGRINPFAQRHKKKERNIRKSSIANNDPYEYLRNMPAGASMLPIDDPKARSNMPSDHSYPVYLMKVSPGGRKYVDEPPMRRGEIRHLNAEGVRIDDSTEVGGLPKDIVKKLRGKSPSPPAASKRTQHAKAVSPNPFGFSMMGNPYIPNTEQAMAMMSVAANLQNNLLRAQNGIPQAKAVLPRPPPPPPLPPPPPPQVRTPSAAKATVPYVSPALRHAGPPLTSVTANAMVQSAISNALQYAQNRMKIDEINKLIARSNANARSQALRQKQAIVQAQQRSMIRSALDIARATGGTPINELNSLKNKMVSAFFPMKKDGVGTEGSGEAAKG